MFNIIHTWKFDDDVDDVGAQRPDAVLSNELPNNPRGEFKPSKSEIDIV